MTTVKIKTAELIRPALDWAVAKCEGTTEVWRSDGPFLWDAYPAIREEGHDVNYRPSTDWAHGGPILESLAGFELKIWMQSNQESRCEAHLHNYEGNWIEFGPTPLIAAMRCYIASKLGDEVEIPEELL